MDRMGLSLQISISRNCNRHENLRCALCQVTMKITAIPPSGLCGKFDEFEKFWTLHVLLLSFGSKSLVL